MPPRYRQNRASSNKSIKISQCLKNHKDVKVLKALLTGCAGYSSCSPSRAPSFVCCRYVLLMFACLIAAPLCPGHSSQSPSGPGCCTRRQLRYGSLHWWQYGQPWIFVESQCSFAGLPSNYKTHVCITLSYYKTFLCGILPHNQDQGGRSLHKTSSLLLACSDIGAPVRTPQI